MFEVSHSFVSLVFQIFSLSDDRIKACKTEQDGRLVEGRHSVYRICAANQEDLRVRKF